MSKHLYSALASLCITGLWAPAGVAQDDPGDYRVEREYALPDDVVITPGPRELKAFDAPRDTARITARELQTGQANDLGEALAAVPGVHLQATNRGAASPLLRGFVGPQNLIVVDGLRFNLATFRTGPNQYIALFDPNALTRIEVLRGPSSVLYGNGAMGGVVQLLTEPLEPAGGATLEVLPRALVRLSSADMGVTSSVGGAMTLGGFGLNAGLTFESLGELRSGGGEEVPLSSLRRLFWRLKAGYAAPDWSLTAAYFGGSVGPAGRVDRLGSGETRTYHNLDHFAYTRFDWRPSAGVVEHFRVAIGYHGVDESVERFNCRKAPDHTVDIQACATRELSQVLKTRLNQDLVQGLNGDARLSLKLLDDRLRLTLGGDIGWDTVTTSTRIDGRAEDDFASEIKARGNFSEGSTFLSTGAYVAATAIPLSLSAGAFQLHLRAGARVSYFQASAPGVPGLGQVSYQHLGVVASGGVQLLIRDTLNIFANFDQGFRAPNLQETTVLGDTGNFFEVPNAELRPERGDTFELGARLAVDPVEVSGTFFYTTLSDAIERAPTTYEGATVMDDKDIMHRVNTASGTYVGVEAELTVAFAQRFKLGGAVTWIQGDLTDSEGQTQPGRRVPPVFGTARLRYAHPSFGAYAELYSRWAAPQDRLSSGDLKDPRICETAPFSGHLAEPCAGTPGWATVGLRAGMRPIDDLRLDVAVSNATDMRYRTHGSGYDAAGVDVRLTLHVGR